MVLEMHVVVCLTLETMANWLAHLAKIRILIANVMN